MADSRTGSALVMGTHVMPQSGHFHDGVGGSLVRATWIWARSSRHRSHGMAGGTTNDVRPPALGCIGGSGGPV
jgi:hypothetical protein